MVQSSSSSSQAMILLWTWSWRKSHKFANETCCSDHFIRREVAVGDHGTSSCGLWLLLSHSGDTLPWPTSSTNPSSLHIVQHTAEQDYFLTYSMTGRKRRRRDKILSWVLTTDRPTNDRMDTKALQKYTEIYKAFCRRDGKEELSRDRVLGGS